VTGLRAIPLSELIDSVTSSAAHLEMRDSYTPSDPVFLAWQSGQVDDLAERYRGWVDLVGTASARGVDFRRARIVSEPITDFIRHEYELASVMNVPAGERVRWLPRTRASDLALPGNDFWLLDGRLVRFGYFTGDGELLGHEVTDDPATVKLCASAFEAVWGRAIDHAEYRPV
jgi:hypothetical protein